MLVASGTLPGAQLGVHARAHERVDERKRAGGLENQPPWRARRRRGRLRRRRGRRAALRGSARHSSPSTATARARAIQPVGKRLRRARTARPTPCELSWLARPAFSRLGAMPRRSSSPKSSRSKNGLPPVARWQAVTKRRIGVRGQRLCCEQRDRMLAQAAGLEDCDLRDHEQLVVQLLHRPGLGRPGRQYERQRHARQPAGEIDQPAQGCEIRQVCVVHGQQHGLCVGQIDREPVEPVQRRKRRLGVAFGVGHKEDGPCKRRRAVAAGLHAPLRPRSPLLAPGAAGRPRTAARARARPPAPTERAGPPPPLGWPRAGSILPIPAGPSKTTAPPEPARAPASKRSTVSSSSSRSTSGASCTATTRF